MTTKLNKPEANGAEPPTAVRSSECVRPHGLLTVIGARNRTEKRSEHAVWAYVIVADEKGNEWIFDASAFSYAMRPND